MLVGGQSQAQAALATRKTRYPLYRRMGGFQGRSGRAQKFSPPPGRPPDFPSLSDSLYRICYRGLTKTVHNLSHGLFGETDEDNENSQWLDKTNIPLEARAVHG